MKIISVVGARTNFY